MCFNSEATSGDSPTEWMRPPEIREGLKPCTHGARRHNQGRKRTLPLEIHLRSNFTIHRGEEAILSIDTASNAGARYKATFEEALNQRRTSNKLMVPKVVRGILEKLKERDIETPRMRAIGDKTFHKNTRDLLLHKVSV